MPGFGAWTKDAEDPRLDSQGPLCPSRSHGLEVSDLSPQLVGGHSPPLGHMVGSESNDTRLPFTNLHPLKLQEQAEEKATGVTGPRS
jgi:hypothetical protein